MKVVKVVYRPSSDQSLANQLPTKKTGIPEQFIKFIPLISSELTQRIVATGMGVGMNPLRLLNGLNNIDAETPVEISYNGKLEKKTSRYGDAVELLEGESSLYIYLDKNEKDDGQTFLTLEGYSGPESAGDHILVRVPLEEKATGMTPCLASLIPGVTEALIVKSGFPQHGVAVDGGILIEQMMALSAGTRVLLASGEKNSTTPQTFAELLGLLDQESSIYVYLSRTVSEGIVGREVVWEEIVEPGSTWEETIGVDTAVERRQRLALTIEPFLPDHPGGVHTVFQVPLPGIEVVG